MKNIFEPVNRHSENELMLEDAYRKALKLDDPVNMSDFSDLYRDVDTDVARVEEIERRFKAAETRESEVDAAFRKMAKVFEVIVSEQMEMSNWLGETAMTKQSSKYDDYINGVDTIVEFDETDGATHLALAVDVTSGHELTRKFDRIKKEIEDGILTKIKYFVSESQGIRGEKANIPRVVIGADRKVIMDLVEKWLEKDQSALAEHVVQAIVIEEIIAQLETFIQYAKSIGQEKVAEVYQRTLGILNRIKTEKELPEGMIADAYDDEVFGAINSGLQRFMK